jgi:hypothetical protein
MSRYMNLRATQGDIIPAHSEMENKLQATNYVCIHHSCCAMFHSDQFDLRTFAEFTINAVPLTNIKKTIFYQCDRTNVWRFGVENIFFDLKTMDCVITLNNEFGKGTNREFRYKFLIEDDCVYIHHPNWTCC